jgi:Spy/CpxP family protein refolding chaperone
LTETDMANLSIKTAMAALLAGSLAVTAGGLAYAKTDGRTSDPAKIQQHIEKRVDRMLTKINATAEQKKAITDILQAAFKDTRSLKDKRIENRKAMEAALQQPTIDPAKIEALRAEQIKVVDETSKRFTKALIDAGNVLSAEQRQALFKVWKERMGWRHG